MSQQYIALLLLQNTATGLYAEPDDSGLHLHNILSMRFTLILSSPENSVWTIVLGY